MYKETRKMQNGYKQIQDGPQEILDQNGNGAAHENLGKNKNVATHERLCKNEIDATHEKICKNVSDATHEKLCKNVNCITHKKLCKNLNCASEAELCYDVNRINILSDKRMCSELDKGTRQVVTVPSNPKLSHIQTHLKSCKNVSIDKEEQILQSLITTEMLTLSATNLDTATKGDVLSSDYLKVKKESRICDLEDIRSIMTECPFSRPSQYYLRVVCDQ